MGVDRVAACQACLLVILVAKTDRQADTDTDTHACTHKKKTQQTNKEKKQQQQMAGDGGGCDAGYTHSFVNNAGWAKIPGGRPAGEGDWGEGEGA